ncbi:MAG: flagellar motor protein MotB [Bacillota bacterium]
MAKKKKKDEGGGAGWLATYGDMVTLLLCFFVLLYAMSSMDEVKWEMIVRSVNPATKETQVVMTQMDEDGEADTMAGGVEGEETEESMEIDVMDMLYEAIKEYVEENDLQEEVEVTQGEGFTFITFLNSIFFAGNEYDLRPEGEEMLDFLGIVLGEANAYIKEVQILGHTSQAEPNVPNDPRTDRFLSSDRAAEVATYLQTNSNIEPYKLISTGFGQYRPISSFDTAEDRAKNRRVEIIITEHNDITSQLNEYYLDVYDVIVDY